MRAQDQAFVTLARRAGLLDPERASHAASVLRAGGVAALVREGILAADAASALLRELATSRFTCDGCGAATDYPALAGLDDLACPACRRPLAIAPAAPSGVRATGARRVSGAHAALRPSDRIPPVSPARPSGAFGALAPAGPSRPSGTFGALAPGTSRPSGAFEALRPAGAFAPARPSGAFPAASPLVAPARPSDRAPAAGAPPRVGPYALVRELGRGSNGVVWLAEREGDRERVALKLLDRAAADDATTLERFRREARIASRLTHPGIVPVIDSGVDGEVPYLVMTFCPGPTLKDRLRGGPLPPDQAAALVAALARAVAYAHGEQVLHRDLKPANVILREDGGPCVTDFGLARDLDRGSELTLTSEAIGTPYYMAPERFRGEGLDDPRTDVYALGVILYECLTGRRPFEATTPADLLQKLEASSPPPPHVANPAVPAALGAVCLRAMARAAADRHPSADALASDLEPFCRPGPVAPAAHRERGVAPDAPAYLEALALALLVVGVTACAAVAWWAFVLDDAPMVGEILRPR